MSLSGEQVLENPTEVGVAGNDTGTGNNYYK